MRCRLEFTDSRFVYARRAYPGIPLLVDARSRFVVPVCDYLRDLAICRRLSLTSVKTYADYLLHFWGYLEAEGLAFENVRDRDLLAWLNTQQVGGVKGLTQAARCDTVFDFYVWLEVNGYIRFAVRVPGHNDGDEQFEPQLSAVAIKSKARRGFSRFGIVSGVRPRANKASLQATPTESDISRLYVAADATEDPHVKDRNLLLIDWYVQVGVRRMEWRSLTVDQIPDWHTIDDLRGLERAHELHLLKTKLDHPRYVGVLPSLLEKTREYMEGPRADIVARFKKTKGSGYHEPTEIFLSNKTGRALTLTAITNLLTGWFKVANVNGHGHRLRASHLSNLLEAEICAEEMRIAMHPGTKLSIDYELVLIKVAERAGQTDIESLRPYLTRVKKRRARSASDVDPVPLQQHVEALRQEAALLEHRIRVSRIELLIPTKNEQRRSRSSNASKSNIGGNA